MKLRKKFLTRVIALVLVVLFGTTLLANTNPAKAAPDYEDRSLIAVTEEGEDGSFSGSVKVNGTNLSEISELTYGQELMIEINWKFADGVAISSTDVLVYQLPTQIKFSSTSGQATSGQIIDDKSDDVLGTYEITDNQVRIHYTDEQFLVNNSRGGRLMFSGTLNGDGIDNSQPTNTTISFDGIGDFEVTVNPIEEDADVAAKKKFIDLDNEDYIYDCILTISSSGNNTNVTVYDEMYPGMVLYGGSPEVYEDSACQIPYTGGMSGFEENPGVRELNGVIDSMSDGEVVYIKYQVQVSPDLYSWNTVDNFFDDIPDDYDKYYGKAYQGKVPNRVVVDSDQDSNDSNNERWADIHTLRYTFYKWNNSNDNIRAEAKLSWQFDINSIDSTYTSGWIIDTIPANSIFVKDFNEIDVYTKSGEYLMPTSEYIELIDQEDSEGHPQVKIKFTNKMLNRLKQEPLMLQYFTKVLKQEEDTVQYDNYAEIFFNGTSAGTSGNNMNFTKPDELKKTAKYDPTTAPNVLYTIKINPASLDINPDGDTIVLKDTMGSALDLDVASIKVNGVAVDTDKLEYYPDERTFTIELNDNTAYVITYNAVVNLKVGETLDETNASNKCELVGLIVKGGDDPTVVNAEVYTSAAGSSSENDGDYVSIEVVKHDEKSVLDVLPKAQFKLEAVVLEDDTVKSHSSVGSGTSGTDGKIKFKDLSRDVVYCLTETKAPEGYKLDSTPTYFVFVSDDDSMAYDVITDKGTEYDVEVISESKAKQVFYIANEQGEDSTTTEEETTEDEDTEDTTTEDITTEDITEDTTTEITTSDVTTESGDDSTTQVTTTTTSTNDNSDKTTGSSSSDKTSTSDKVVVTGDCNIVSLAIVMAVASLLLMCGFIIQRRKLNK